MKVWTHQYAWETGETAYHPYWTVAADPVLLIEYDDGQCEWRRVSDAQVIRQPMIGDHHKCKLLDQKYYPQWFKDWDYAYIDEGL